jgi:hypothetical protein
LQAELIEEYGHINQDEQDVDGGEGPARDFVFEGEEHF